MNTEHPEHAQQLTLQDIVILAEKLGVQFSDHENAFDLDRPYPLLLEGTYRKTQAGIETAYGDLMRHRLLVRDIQGGSTIGHLALDCQQIPNSVASLLKALTAYFSDQSDPTGLKVHNLRSQVQGLGMTFDHIDGLLGIIEQQRIH